jgi:NitT/TauT family transport system substrate-binding protein
MRPLHLLLPAALLAGAGVFAATTALTPPAQPAHPSGALEVRLGYFPNVTHATAIVGVERGLFAKELGDSATLKPYTFNAGPAAIEALLSGALDATYIGPNPAVNAFVKSHGEAVRVICGATSGGAALVVDPSIATAADLKGKKLASPQLGNTQDVALRAWLKAQGFKSSLTGESDVAVVPQDNAQTLDAFRQHQIAGAWVPEPWATRLLLEGGGKTLVDERDLWPEKRFVTVHLLVSTKFLKEQPDAVRALLRAHLAAEDWTLANTAEAQNVVNDGIGKVTGKKLAQATIEGAWKNLEFTHDPIASSLIKSAHDAEEVGLLKLGDADLRRIYDLKLLNEVLGNAKRPLVASGGH